MGRNITDSLRRVFSQPLAYPLFIYLLGFAVVLKYILTTSYLGGATICSEFALYMHYTTGAEWHPMVYPFSLQNSCLPVAWLPARLQIITGVDPVLFYKIYHALLLPLLPMVAYFVFRRFLTAHYALIGSLFVIGTVTFLQSPSMARTTIALIFYALLLLVFFNKELKHRVLLVVGLSVLLVLSHYTTAYLAILIFSSLSLVLAIRWVIQKKGGRQLGISLLAVVILITCGIFWYGQVNKYALYKVGVRTVAVTNTIEEIGDTGSCTMDLSSRDKIIQAAFGVHNPDGDTIFHFNWWLFGVSWLVVGLIIWGMAHSVFRKELPAEFLMLSAICFALIIFTILIPGASRGYGIERVFYQCTPLFGVLLVKGTSSLGRYSWAVLLPLILAYGYLNMNYGVIHSLIGR